MSANDIYVESPDEIQIMSDSIDAMFNAWGKYCSLIFASSGLVQCPNCLWDSSNQRSANVYKPGGPVPFQTGICPVCNGRGRVVQQERTKTIRLMIRWNPSEFIMMPNINITVPNGLIETEGKIADLPDVLKSRILIAELPLVPILRARFELSGEPVDPNSIAQGKTFLCHWKRQGG
jgi:hypothetical protein